MKLRPQHFRQLRGFFSAAHREVGLAAAFAAEFGAEVGDDLAGLVTGFDSSGRTECVVARSVTENGAELFTPQSPTLEEPFGKEAS